LYCPASLPAQSTLIHALVNAALADAGAPALEQIQWLTLNQSDRSHAAAHLVAKEKRMVDP
jgi:hypothetical protein